jgi:hypothetical protein
MNVDGFTTKSTLSKTTISNSHPILQLSITPMPHYIHKITEHPFSVEFDVSPKGLRIVKTASFQKLP